MTSIFSIGKALRYLCECFKRDKWLAVSDKQRYKDYNNSVKAYFILFFWNKVLNMIAAVWLMYSYGGMTEFIATNEMGAILGKFILPVFPPVFWGIVASCVVKHTFTLNSDFAASALRVWSAFNILYAPYSLGFALNIFAVWDFLVYLTLMVLLRPLIKVCTKPNPTAQPLAYKQPVEYSKEEASTLADCMKDEPSSKSDDMWE